MTQIQSYKNQMIAMYQPPYLLALTAFYIFLLVFWSYTFSENNKLPTMKRSTSQKINGWLKNKCE